MTDKLSLFNGALTRHIGQDKLNALSDNVPARHALDIIWDGGAVETCLEQGQWDFAARTSKLEYEPSITPTFGYAYAFERPTDFVRIMAVCHDGYLRVPMRYYNVDGGYWYADQDSIYVRYVSKDNQHGLDFSLWPPNFTRYVECYLAVEAGPRVGLDDKKIEKLENRRDRLLITAKGTDAMENPSIQPPPGSWSSARGGRGRSDRGSRSRLIG